MSLPSCGLRVTITQQVVAVEARQRAEAAERLTLLAQVQWTDHPVPVNLYAWKLRGRPPHTPSYPQEAIEDERKRTEEMAKQHEEERRLSVTTHEQQLAVAVEEAKRIRPCCPIS